MNGPVSVRKCLAIITLSQTSFRLLDNKVQTALPRLSYSYFADTEVLLLSTTNHSIFFDIEFEPMQWG